MNAYNVVEMFERRVAAHFGSLYGIAVSSCTDALFLSLKYRQYQRGATAPDYVLLPKRTYISVPFAAMDAGLKIHWNDMPWRKVYALWPWGVMDAAKAWRRKPYSLPWERGLWCVSFHIKKPIPIGRGGMILTSERDAAEWLRKARYDGRSGLPFDQERVAQRGWHKYMEPEQAARGLRLMDIYPNGVDIPEETYPDLSLMPVFQREYKL